MSGVTLSLSDLSIGYHKKVVAQGLNASLTEGSMTCLLGPNGAGKSTLIRTLAGFQPPLNGHIYIGGDDIRSLSRLQLARKVSVVLTQRTDAANLTVEELVGLGRSPYTGFFGSLRDSDRKMVAAALKLTGISALAHRKVYSLSDGERQKTMIAKAITQQTPLILLDEPTSFLDFSSRISLLRLLRRLAHDEGRTIFLSTHDVQLAMQLADALWLMSPCKSITIGTPRQLADSGAVVNLLGCEGASFNPSNFTFSIQSGPSAPEPGTATAEG